MSLGLAIVFLGLVAGGSARADEARELAARLLDETVSREGREAIVREHPDLAARLLAEMTAGLAPGSPEEARRIPWIWRVAIAAARRDEGPEILRILDVALPAPTRRWMTGGRSSWAAASSTGSPWPADGRRSASKDC